MDQALEELQQRISVLECDKPVVCEDGSYHRRCRCCGAILVTPTLYICDAGQAYEALDRKHIHTALDFVCDKANATPKTRQVYVTHSQRSCTGFGGSIFRPYKDRTIFYVKSIKRAVVAFLSMRFYKLCDLFLFQASGIPIGGPLSSYILDLTIFL